MYKLLLVEDDPGIAAQFIARRIRVQVEPLLQTVVTGEKWLGFVVEQVLSNALKYSPDG